MSFPGLLLVLVATAAESPPGSTLGSPALTRGDRIPFAGEVADDVDNAGRVSKRAFTLDATLFVLDTHEWGADCALFTRLTPKTDPGVVAAAANVMGTSADGRQSPPITRLERIRIDRRGRVSRLVTPDRPPPLPLGLLAKTAPLPPLSLEEPPQVEVGMFVPLPETPPAVGAQWTVADGVRPSRTWAIKRSELRNGGVCFLVEAVQQSAGWADLAKVAAGWQRFDRLVVSPTDGLARSVVRQVVHREGNAAVRTMTVRYEIQPTVPHKGKSYRDVCTEIDTATWLGGKLDGILAAGGKPDAAAIERVRSEAKRHIEDRPATAFRPAVEAVLLRAEAALGGRALGGR
ncbi:MAG TPA: hypothetical protein VGJ05_01850 [Fimbriiglobus sp.]